MTTFTIDHDPVSGQFSQFRYDADNDELVFSDNQYVDGIIEANKRDYTAGHRPSGDGLGARVASIPLHIYFQLRREGIVQDPKAFARWLNDRDNLAFRTAPGNV